MVIELINNISISKITKYFFGKFDVILILLIIVLYFYSDKLFSYFIVSLLLLGILTLMACKPKYLVGLLFLELAIGGAGRWFVLPAGISVRILLFISVFAFAFLGLSINERKLQNSPFLLPVLIMGIFIPFFWGFGIAIFKGNTLLHILDDCNGQLFYLLFIPMTMIIRDKFELKTVLNFLLAGIFVLALINNLIYICLISGILELTQLELFLQASEIGKAFFLYDSSIFRIYFKSAIFWQIGLIIVISYIIFEKKSKLNLLRYSFLIVVGIALISSYTRGFWIGFLISLIFLFYKARIRINQKMIFVSILLFIALNQYLTFYHQFSVIIFIGDRLLSIFQFDTDFSVNYRILQFSKALDQIIKNPIIGSGYGAVLEGYGSFNIELGYMDLVVKLGSLGFILWFSLMAHIFLTCSNILKKCHDPSDKALAVGLMAGAIGLFFTSGTNPFIMASLGIGYMILLMLGFEKLRFNYGPESS